MEPLICFVTFSHPVSKMRFLLQSMPPDARHAVLAHIVHLVNRDYEEMAKVRRGGHHLSVDVY